MVGTKSTTMRERGSQGVTCGCILACSQGFDGCSLPVNSPLTSAEKVQDAFMAVNDLECCSSN